MRDFQFFSRNGTKGGQGKIDLLGREMLDGGNLHVEIQFQPGTFLGMIKPLVEFVPNHRQTGIFSPIAHLFRNGNFFSVTVMRISSSPSSPN